MPGRGLNKAMIIGYLGRDPDFRNATNGGAIAKAVVATTASWKDRNTGERQERTEWHRVVFFGRLAEIVNDYLKKGSHVYIEGRLQTNKWQDKEGIDRYTTEIVCNEMQMLDSRHSSGSNYGGGHGGGDNRGGDDNIGNRAPSGNRGSSDGFDDDIPF